jgi:hypothetical protein
MARGSGQHSGGSMAGRTSSEGVQAMLWTAKTDELQRGSQWPVLGKIPGQQE